jgi:hypothetical protein
MLVSFITFSAPSVTALLALRKGDACSIAGRASRAYFRQWYAPCFRDCEGGLAARYRRSSFEALM